MTLDGISRSHALALTFPVPLVVLAAALGGVVSAVLLNRILALVFRRRGARAGVDDYGVDPLSLWLVGVATLLLALARVAPASQAATVRGLGFIGISVAGGLIALALIRRALAWLRQRDVGVERSDVTVLVPFLLRAARFATVVAGFVAAAEIAGIPARGVWASMGVTGLAVAIGARRVFEGVAGGFIIGIEQPFRRGDRIRLVDERGYEVEGVVERMALHATWLRTANALLFALPNSRVEQMAITNLTRRVSGQVWFKLRLDPHCPTEKLTALVGEVDRWVRANAGNLPNAPAGAVLRLLDGGALVLEVSFGLHATETDKAQSETQSVLLSVLEMANARGIEVAQV